MRVRASAASRFAEATGSDWRPGEPGTPLLFGVVPLREALVAPLREHVPPDVWDTVPVLHGEHVARFIAPLDVGSSLLTTSRHLATRVRPSGTAITVLAEIHADSGELLEQHEMTAFLPRVALGDDCGSRTPLVNAAAGELEQVVRIPTSPDQSRGYAEASGDRTAFHVSDEQAREFGFPGVIMHGLCTLALSLNELSRRARREFHQVGARFAAPGLPGDDIVLRYAAVTEDRYAFAAESPSGAGTLTHGAVDCAPGRALGA